MAIFGTRNRNRLRLVSTDRVKIPLWSRIKLPARNVAFYVVIGAIAAGLFAFNVARSGAETVSRNLPICGSAKRINCVVDGDTIWLEGEKIRLESFNTPEMNGKCFVERQLAQQAKMRLRQILSAEPFKVSRNGKDRYGRTLAVISNSSGNVGDILIREGLAHEWRGRKESWCG